MESLLKRHFWTINLCGLAVIAYLFAGSINSFIGMKLAGKTSTELTVEPAKGDGSDNRLNEKLRSSRSDISAGGMMAARSPFLIDEPINESEQEEEEEEQEQEEEGAEGAEEELDPTYEVTTLPVKLRGTMVVWPTRYSSATMEVERKTHKLVIVGFNLLKGQATVHEIHRRYVVLKESGKLTIAPLWPRPAGERKSSGGAESTTPTKKSKRAKVASRQTAEGVRRISDTSFQLERQMLNRKLKNLASLGQQARVVPNYHRGKYDGFRLIGMRNNSLFRNIGFENGDIVKVINGGRIDSPNKALALYEALKNKSRLTVQLERGGILKTMRYIVR
jgi:general secretion pathway protein C